MHVVADPRPGAHVALIPLFKGAEIGSPGWVRLRVQVKAGRIGMLTWGKMNMITLAPLFMYRSKEPIEIGFSVPNLRNCEYVIVYNASPIVPAQFDLLDATVSVSEEEWRKSQAALAAVR